VNEVEIIARSSSLLCFYPANYLSTAPILTYHRDCRDQKA